MQEVFVESFDATKLFFNRELVEDARAAIVIVHGLCEHQGRYDYFAEKLHQAGSARIASTTEAMADPRAREPITAILTKSSTTPMYS